MEPMDIREGKALGKDILPFFPHSRPRPYQKETVSAIIESFGKGYKYVFLEAPTGFGKSAVAIALARYLGEAYILASSKLLQKQYEKDFGLRTVTGRQNFPCLLDSGKTVDLGDCVTKKEFRCKHLPSPAKTPAGVKVAESASRGPLHIGLGEDICPYWRQKCDALNEDIVAFNYDYFLSESNSVGDFPRKRLIVCDEAHNIEAKLMSHLSFSISNSNLSLINETVPERNIQPPEWIPVLAEWMEKFEIYIEKHTIKEGRVERDKAEILQSCKERLRRLQFLIRELTESPATWVVNSMEEAVEFRPIDVSRFSGMLFRKAEHFLLQSATILDPETMARSLGISGDCAFLRVPSAFPEESRLIHVEPAGSMSRNSYEESLKPLAEKVKDIMERHPDEKGVVHTHTYRLAQDIVSAIGGKRLVSHGKEGREAAFDEFLTSRGPLVLVTPSAYEGVDFKYDFCRFQIICKVPYPHLGDPQVKARMEIDPKWYSWMTAVRLVQTYGRGMRAEDDYCATYLIDSDFIQFYRQNYLLLPGWFKSALRQETY